MSNRYMRIMTFEALTDERIQVMREAVMESIAAEFGACSNVTADLVLAALGLIPIEQSQQQQSGRV